MSKISFPHCAEITDKQKNYIEILSNDLGLSRLSRNQHIIGIIKRNISDLDSLSRDEASRVIEKMKEWKEQKQ